MVMNKQQYRTEHSQDRESPPLPEGGQFSFAAEVLDTTHQDQKDRVDLVLSGLGIMVDQPGPTQLSTGPDFLIAPHHQKNPGGYENERPDSLQELQSRRRILGPDQQRHGNECPTNGMGIEL